jgi:hypothetical protein
MGDPMMTLATVTLNADLAAALQETAAQDGERLEDVLETLARAYIRRARRERIRVEGERFAMIQGELQACYPGEHVAIYAGEVVDHDRDPLALARRVRERFGHQPVLVRSVEGPVTLDFVMRSPRLVKLA